MEKIVHDVIDQLNNYEIDQMDNDEIIIDSTVECVYEFFLGPNRRYLFISRGLKGIF